MLLSNVVVLVANSTNGETFNPRTANHILQQKITTCILQNTSFNYPTMARVTARQAFTRARSKKFQELDRKAKELRQAKQRFFQQILGVVNTKNNKPSERKPVSQLPSSSSLSSTLVTSSNKHNQMLNHKITEYYSVKAKGRENVPQTPPRLGRNIRQHRNKSNNNTYNSSIDGDPIVITIEDTDDEQDLDTDNEVENDIQDRLSQDYKTSEDTSDDERDECGSTSGRPLESPFMDPNFSIKLEEDLEIVDMLPPIALRDHPVIDLDQED